MRTYIAFVMLVASSFAWAGDEPAAAPRLLATQELPVEVSSQTLQKQYDALLGMSLQRIEYSTRGPVHLIQGNTGMVLPAEATGRKEGDSANDILPLIKDIVLASGTETLSVRGVSVLDSSARALKLSQSIRGIPVIHGRVAIGYDELTKRVDSVTTHFIPDRGLPREPKLSAKQAEQVVPEVLAAAEKLSSTDIRIKEGTYLGYYADPVSPTPPQLVWAIRVFFADGTYEMFYVDAITGVIAGRERLSHGLIQKVYDANGDAIDYPDDLPTPMTSTQINLDPEAKAANENVGDADAELLQRFPFGVSDFPSRTDILVRYGSVPNSFHNLIGGIDYLWFSGDLPGFYSIALSKDAAYHEYAHSIDVRAFSYFGDTYDYQTGALHEMFGDFAATVVNVAMGEGAGIGSPTWIIAEGIFKDEPSSKGIRSFANPFADPQSDGAGQNRDWFPSRPMGMNQLYNNSTILSHGYYLLIQGGLHAR